MHTHTCIHTMRRAVPRGRERDPSSACTTRMQRCIHIRSRISTHTHIHIYRYMHTYHAWSCIPGAWTRPQQCSQTTIHSHKEPCRTHTVTADHHRSNLRTPTWTCRSNESRFSGTRCIFLGKAVCLFVTGETRSLVWWWLGRWERVRVCMWILERRGMEICWGWRWWCPVYVCACISVYKGRVPKSFLPIETLVSCTHICMYACIFIYTHTDKDIHMILVQMHVIPFASPSELRRDHPI